MFEPVKARLVCLEVSDLELVFPYNPKEFSITRNSGFSSKDDGSGPWGGVKWDCGKPDELKFDIVLDVSEPELSFGADAAAMMLPISSLASIAGHRNTDSVVADIQTLHQMTIPRKLDDDGTYVRPPFCVFLWGDVQFFGGITTVESKVVLFDIAGRPKRAEVSVSMIGQAFHTPTKAEELTGTAKIDWKKMDKAGKLDGRGTTQDMDPRLAMLGVKTADAAEMKVQ